MEEEAMIVKGRVWMCGKYGDMKRKRCRKDGGNKE